MSHVSHHLRTKNAEARCNSCGVNLVPDANRNSEFCLICQAAMLNWIFQARRQEDQTRASRVCEDGQKPAMHTLLWGT
jgi:hypothetical protein